MAVIEQKDTKQQIIERLDGVPPEKLSSVLDYVRFVSLDEPDYLTDRERELVQETRDDPRPDVPDSEVRKILGM